MIVKSIRWKTPSFERLLNYCFKGRSKGDGVYYHNTLQADYSGIKSALIENDKHLNTYGKRKRVRIYHEVIRWHSDDAKHLTKEMLEEFSKEYIRIRANDSVATAIIHSKPEPHIHLVISGCNLADGKTLTRMDNKKFRSVKREIEEYQLAHYPQLEKSIVYLNKDKRRLAKGAHAKLQKKYQMNHRIEKRLEVKSVVQKCMDSAYTVDQFYDLILQSGLEMNRRKNGKITGVKYKNLPFRFDKMDINLTQLEAREKALTKTQLDLLKLKQKKKDSKERHRNR